MLPVVASTNTFSFQTPLVNTTTPGTNITRVPYDNVAPSVSSAQVDNNTQGNNTIVSSSNQQAPASETAAAAEEGASGFLNQIQRSVSASLSSGVQSTFVAQLAAQDSSPETNGILVEYEKLVANANVKYKPSNAAKPQDGPSSVFGRILQSEKPAVQANEAPAPRLEAVASASNNQAASEAIETAPIEPRQQVRPNKPSTTQTTNDSAESAAPAASTSNDAVAPRAISAYVGTAQRVAVFASGTNSPIDAADALA